MGSLARHNGSWRGCANLRFFADDDVLRRGDCDDRFLAEETLRNNMNLRCEGHGRLPEVEADQDILLNSLDDPRIYGANPVC